MEADMVMICMLGNPETIDCYHVTQPVYSSTLAYCCMDIQELKDQALCNWEIVQYSISSVGLGLKIYVFLGNHMIKNRLLESEIFFFIFLVLKHIFT